MQDSGQPLTSNQALIGAAVCALITVWLLLAARFPALRFGFAWEGLDRPMSAFAFIAWAVCGASWAILLLATAFHYTPITDHGGWIVGAGVVAIALGLARDLLVRR